VDNGGFGYPPVQLGDLAIAPDPAAIVPEPAAFSVLLLGGAFGLSRRRRRGGR
jgi:hypothetical protein